MTAEKMSICHKGHALYPVKQGQKRSCKYCANDKRRTQLTQGLLPEQTIVCPHCQQVMQKITLVHIREHGFSSVSEFKIQYGLDSVHSKAQRDRVSKQFKGVELPYKPNLKRRGFKYSAKSRAKMSASAVARCLKNPGPLYSRIRGDWVFSEKANEHIYARSSYEERLIRVLDEIPDVEYVKNEPFSIPYQFDGVEYQYIPDFLVTFECGIKELWEVKPAKFLKDPRNQAKFAALNGYVSTHDMNGAIITLECIQNLEAMAYQFNIDGVWPPVWPPSPENTSSIVGPT